MLWMCIYFPKLSLEVFTHHESIDIPFAIEETHKNQRLVVHCNALAEQAGVQAGMTIPTAHGLCEHLRIKERNIEIEKQTLQQLALLFSQFTPTITIQAPNHLLLEIGSCLQLFKGLKNLHSKIHTQIQELGYHFQLAVAKTPLAAEMAARLIKDDEKYLINEVYLKQIPIKKLNYRSPQTQQIDHKTLQRLQGIGFRRLGEIMDLPKAELGKRFGQSFLNYLDKLTGKTIDVRDIFEPPLHFEQHIHFVEELDSLSSLLFPLKRLLGHLQSYLQQRQQTTTSIIVLLENRNHQTDPIPIRFAEPQQQASQILPLIQLKFETLTLPDPIITIGLKAIHFVEQTMSISDLFLQDDANNSDKATLLNRLKSRLGDNKVHGLKLLNDHRPENCWTYTSPTQKKSESQTKPRPLWLLPQPQQLTDRGGTPCWHGPLKLLQGPERIETGWWDNNPINRDYYVAQHHQGALLWVFQDKAIKENNSWFLHGLFS